jgi:hypothetical protein
VESEKMHLTDKIHELRRLIMKEKMHNLAWKERGYFWRRSLSRWGDRLSSNHLTEKSRNLPIPPKNSLKWI